MLKQLIQYAIDNYESDGWDIMVETMEDSYVEAIIAHCESLEEAIETMKAYIQPIHENREEIRSTAW